MRDVLLYMPTECIQKYGKRRGDTQISNTYAGIACWGLPDDLINTNGNIQPA